MFRMKSQMIAQLIINLGPRVGLTKLDQKARRIMKDKISNLKPKSNYSIKLRDNGVIDCNQANKRIATVCKGKANKNIALSVKPKEGWHRKNLIGNRWNSINGIQHSQSHFL